MNIKVIKIKGIEYISSSNEKFSVCSIPSLEESYNSVLEIAKDICNTLMLSDSKNVKISMLTSNGTYTATMKYDLISPREWEIFEESLQTL